MSGASALLRQHVLAAAAAATTLIATSYAYCRESDDAPKTKGPKLLFLGTGSSTGCPKPFCTMLYQNDSGENPERTALRQQWEKYCRVSNMAIEGDPRENRNYRNNPSLLISHYQEAGECRNVVIDVGKTFREASLRWMPVNGISSLDGIVLTHQHMDAAAGLDDVRGFQKVIQIDPPPKQRGNTNNTRPPIRRVPAPVYLSQFTLDELSNQFHWLFPKQQQQQQPPSNDDKPIVHRDVASFDVNVIHSYQPFVVAGLEMIPLPVWHGDDLICHGFAFGLVNSRGKRTSVVYLSDISRMVPETLEYIQTKLPPTDILVVDALLLNRSNPVHFTLKQALDLIRTIKPKQAYLVGMTCDSFLPHDEMNQELALLREGSDGVNVQLAHDGLVLNL